MISLQSWTILIFAVFFIREGTCKIHPRRSKDITRYDSSLPFPDNVHELNHEMPHHFVEGPPNVRGNPTHPDHPEMFENQPAPDPQPGYEVPENPDSATFADTLPQMDQMTELMPGSGVLINGERLRTIMEQSYESSNQLRQRLLAELSPQHVDIMDVPRHIFAAVEVYSRQAVPRSQPNQQQLHRVLEDLLPHQDIDNMRLDRILGTYLHSPRELQRNLFAELLDLRRNVPMGIGDVPLHIRNAVEEIMRLSSPELSHDAFMRNLSHQLRMLQRRNPRNRSPRRQ